jgi:hypothetical protein
MKKGRNSTKKNKINEWGTEKVIWKLWPPSKAPGESVASVIVTYLLIDVWVLAIENKQINS